MWLEEFLILMLEVLLEVEFFVNDFKVLVEIVSINVRDGSEGNLRE